jgi:hypothetical protein
MLFRVSKPVSNRDSIRDATSGIDPVSNCDLIKIANLFIPRPVSNRDLIRDATSGIDPVSIDLDYAYRERQRSTSTETF